VAPKKLALQRVQSMINNNSAAWITAIVIGSLINIGLFLFLPAIGRTPPPQEPQIIEVEFMAWQQPIQQKTKTPEKIKQKPKDQPKPKPQPKKKEIKPLPKPMPKPVPRPVLSEKALPEKIKTKPIKPPTTKPELPTPTPLKKTTDTAAVELPTPVPIFKLTSLPRMIHRQRPTYPPDMRQQGKEATVKLEVLLDIKGVVRKVTIKKSGGDAFDQAAIEAIKSSTFMPANINGKPVAVLMKIPVNFRLR